MSGSTNYEIITYFKTEECCKVVDEEIHPLRELHVVTHSERGVDVVVAVFPGS